MARPDSQPLTAKRIASAGVPDARIELADAAQPGLRLRITPNGVRTWVWTKRVDGRLQRVTIGRYPEIDIPAARKAAAVLSGQAALGEDPRAEVLKRRARSQTLADAYRAYVKAKRLRPRTLEDYDALFAKLSALHGVPVTEIQRADVRREHARIARDSVARADGAMRVLRAVLNRAFDDLAEAGEVVPSNPVKALTRDGKWTQLERKRGHIPTDRLPEFVAAVRADGSPLAGDLVLTLLGTGWRLGETRRLLWSDVDLVAGVVGLRAEETKAARAVTLPIPDQIVTMLQMRLEASSARSRYVFPDRQGKGPITSAKALLARVGSVTGIEVGHHDLRRSFAIAADRLGIGVYTTKRLLNHATDRRDVTSGYVATGIADLRAAQQRIADALLGPLA